MTKIFRFFAVAYLFVAVFFFHQAFIEWNQEGGRSYVYLFFAILAVLMFFFKRNFRKRYDSNNKNN